MPNKMLSSEYIESERKTFALYTLQNRALPSVCDGLKAAARRALWTARNGEEVKTATLAGATMPLHPHAPCDSSINTLAAPFGNNIPLFTGSGAFGTLINPTAYGASRYTSVQISDFTKEVVFRDIEIIPKVLNYDDTLEEPEYFLPLVPVALINPSEGIAVGFATNILPRSLSDIIDVQINHLQGKRSRNKLIPTFFPTNSVAVNSPTQEEDRSFDFVGEIEVHNTSSITITALPYGQSHERVLTNLDKLVEIGVVTDFVDESRDTIKINVKFKRGCLRGVEHGEILKKLALTSRQHDNINVLNFDNVSVWSTNPHELTRKFTEWRLGWYVKRYERLRDLLQLDLQRLYDVRTAIENDVGGIAKKIKSRSEMKELLEAMGVVNLDYIADLPVYRFTEEEKIKIEKRIKEGEKTLSEYKAIIASKEKRVEIYINELREVRRKFGSR